jgi:DNA-binding NtrC family response regulator
VSDRSPASARLVVVQGDASCREAEVRGALVIGRGENCDIVLLDGASSRQHARVEKRGSVFVVVDLESTNGTFVNGARVRERRLEDGDEVALGGVRLRFRAPIPAETYVVGGAAPRVQTQGSAAAPAAAPIGRSAPFLAARALAERAAKSGLPVLLRGETGTGKEVFARYMHSMGARAEGPFVALHAAAVPQALFEAELFGSEKGAFTGAEGRREGFLARAHGGTLFLDEVGEIPVESQVKLLRVLETGEYHPVGSSQSKRSDFRLLAATNRDLDRAVREGSFRSDLLFRLNAIEIRLPALRERLEDLPLFVDAFLRGTGKRAAPDLLESLRGRDWPGNIRELRHALERALLLCEGDAIGAGDLPLPAIEEPSEPAEATVERLSTLSLDRAEKEAIVRALANTGGRRGDAARLLGISEPTLRRKLRRYGLDEES